MIGKLQKVWTAADIAKGMSTSAYSSDGGFSSESYNINPLLTPGAIRPTAAATDISANVVGDIIASCEGTGAKPRLFVDRSANFYSYDGTSTITKEKTGSATYQRGVTDIVPFNGKWYASSVSDVSEWNNAATLTETWLSSTLGVGSMTSGVPHPLLVYNKSLYVGDANILRVVSTVPTATVALTLDASESIYALGFDPGTGQMLISTQSVPTTTGAQPSQRYIYLYDGASTKPSRKIPVNDLVLGFYNVGSIVFCGTIQTLQYWNGTGLTFLRSLKSNIAFTQTPDQQPWKSSFANIGNLLLVADGKNVLAYGETLEKSPKIFWYLYQTSNAGAISCLADLGKNRLGVAYPSAKLDLVDISSAGSASNGGLLYLNRLEFDRPSYIRRLRIITQPLAAGSHAFPHVMDEAENVYTVSSPASATLSGSAAGKAVHDFDYSQLKVMSVKPYMSLVSATVSILKVIVYYDTAE